jgi:DNA-binding winged helix-turn-helix (wHTH) protein
LLYRFDDFLLDPARRELWRGASAVEVAPQVFDLLTYLIQNRERVVSQNDLLAEVWKGRIVSESTMRSHINAVRTAIGDNGEDQRLIRTVPRKGFRFVGTITETDALVPPVGGNLVAAAHPEPAVIESIPEPSMPAEVAKLMGPAALVPQHPNPPLTEQSGELGERWRWSVRAKIAAVGVGLAAVVALGAIVSSYSRSIPASATSRVAEPSSLSDLADYAAQRVS